MQKYYHKQILSSRRKVLPQNEISYHSKKFLATRRCFCNIKLFLVTERNFLSQEEEIYFTVKKYLPEEIVWPKTFLFNWKSIKSIYPLYLLWLDGGGVWISHIFPNLNYFAIILQYYLYKKCLHFKIFPISAWPLLDQLESWKLAQTLTRPTWLR